MIYISALGPTIGEQAKKQGLVATGMSIDLVDSLSHHLTRAHIHGVLTDTEVDRARRRLLNLAKFKEAKK
jgi:hypothetical protein